MTIQLRLELLSDIFIGTSSNIIPVQEPGLAHTSFMSSGRNYPRIHSVVKTIYRLNASELEKKF